MEKNCSSNHAPGHIFDLGKVNAPLSAPRMKVYIFSQDANVMRCFVIRYISSFLGLGTCETKYTLGKSQPEILDKTKKQEFPFQFETQVGIVLTEDVVHDLIGTGPEQPGRNV